MSVDKLTNRTPWRRLNAFPIFELNAQLYLNTCFYRIPAACLGVFYLVGILERRLIYKNARNGKLYNPKSRVLLKKGNSAQASLNSFILWKPKAYYRVNSSLPFFIILNQTILVHAIPSCFFTIHSIIVLPPARGIFRFPQRNPAHLPLYVPHALPTPFF